MNIFYSKLFIVLLSFLFFFINIYLFYPVLTSSSLIFPYSIRKFDIVIQYPLLWQKIKYIYYLISYISIFIITNSLLSFNLKNSIKKRNKKNSKPQIFETGLNLLVGYDNLNQEKIYIPEKALYQNILVTGTIGSRKN